LAVVPDGVCIGIDGFALTTGLLAAVVGADPEGWGACRNGASAGGEDGGQVVPVIIVVVDGIDVDVIVIVVIAIVVIAIVVLDRVYVIRSGRGLDAVTVVAEVVIVRVDRFAFATGLFAAAVFADTQGRGAHCHGASLGLVRAVAKGVRREIRLLQVKRLLRSAVRFVWLGRVEGERVGGAEARASDLRAEATALILDAGIATGEARGAEVPVGQVRALVLTGLRRGSDELGAGGAGLGSGDLALLAMQVGAGRVTAGDFCCSVPTGVLAGITKREVIELETVEATAVVGIGPPPVVRHAPAGVAFTDHGVEALGLWL